MSWSLKNGGQALATWKVVSAPSALPSQVAASSQYCPMGMQNGILDPPNNLEMLKI